MTFPSTFELSSLNGKNGFVINGVLGLNRSGGAVSSAGDMNGDGIDDIVIGAFGASPIRKRYPGETYVVFGRSRGFEPTLELSSLNGRNGFVMYGIDDFDFSGRSVSRAGDINDDGIDDIIIGAAAADPKGRNSAGESYVVFGSTQPFAPTLRLSRLNGNNGFVIHGIEAGDSSGAAVSAAGDINGDGIDDLLIGASGADPNDNVYAGASYVVFGRQENFEPTLELSNLNGRNGFAIHGIDSLGAFGNSVSDAGDINGDGIDDIIIGAYYADLDTRSLAGRTYVIFGQTETFNSSLDLSSLNGNNGFVINGIDRLDNSGRSVSGAGDINGDGIGDIIIGAGDASDRGQRYAGESYVVFGSKKGFSPTLELSSLTGKNGFVIRGVSARDYSGISVSSVGDINSDGIDDLLIGASGADPNGVSSGESYVVFGSTEDFDPIFELLSLNGRNGFAIHGIDAGDLSGRSVSGAGDVNGDGIQDLVIGALGAAPNGQRLAGESYVVFGKRQSIELLGTSERDRLRGGADAEILFGLEGNDILFGGAGQDTLEGGQGNDQVLGGAGSDLLVGGAGRDRLKGENGLDTLVGGAGRDTFIFDSFRLQRDTIEDFQGGIDQILIRSQGFDPTLERGLFSEEQFVLGSKALDEGDRLIYNNQTGRLFFDADGSGPGRMRAIAILRNTPNLTASDIRLV